MQPCLLTIVTSTDGEERVFSQGAEMELAPLSAVLCYNQEGGSVRLCLENGMVTVERTGAYVLRLCLAEGKTTRGVLGLPGMEGEVETTTGYVGYTIRERSLLLSIKYTLRFDSGSQEMKIRLAARSKGNSEE